MTEHVVHERVQIDGERGDVVVVVRREITVSETSQVGRDDLEARVHQRRDVAPPDAPGLRPPVHEQERHTADTFAKVRKGGTGRERRPMRGKPVGVEVVGHESGVCQERTDA